MFVFSPMSLFWKLGITSWGSAPLEVGGVLGGCLVFLVGNTVLCILYLHTWDLFRCRRRDVFTIRYYLWLCNFKKFYDVTYSHKCAHTSIRITAFFANSVYDNAAAISWWVLSQTNSTPVPKPSGVLYSLYTGAVLPGNNCIKSHELK